jgi:hypothetical protein
MARAILLFLAKRLGLARVSKFETRPATSQNQLNVDEAGARRLKAASHLLYSFFLSFFLSFFSLTQPAVLGLPSAPTSHGVNSHRKTRLSLK